MKNKKKPMVERRMPVHMQLEAHSEANGVRSVEEAEVIQEVEDGEEAWAAVVEAVAVVASMPIITKKMERVQEENVVVVAEAEEEATIVVAKTQLTKMKKALADVAVVAVDGIAEVVEAEVVILIKKKEIMREATEVEAVVDGTEEEAEAEVVILTKKKEIKKEAS
jgi:hypothetical protein